MAMQPEKSTTSIERGRPPLTRRSGASDGPPRALVNAPATPVSAAPVTPVAPASSGGAGAGRQPSDAPWSTVFGSQTLPSDCRTVVVDGARVYLGGDFIYGMAGTANDTYERVAMWDGSGWQPMGAGL